MDLTNPITLIIGGILLLAILYFWNKSNVSKHRERRNRNFRSSYYQRRKNQSSSGEKDEKETRRK